MILPIKVSQANYTERIKRFLESEEVKAYTMAILSFFAISFFTVFAIKPTLNTFFALRRQIQDYEKFDKQLEDKINKLLKAQEQYYVYKNDLYLLTEALPSDPQFTSMIKKIESISAETKTLLAKLEIKEVSFINDQKNPENTKKSDYLSYDFNVGLEGPYLDNETFLRRLINLRRIIDFTSLKMRSKETEQEKNIETDIGAKTYYLNK